MPPPDIDSAIAVLRREIALRPGDVRVINELARALSENGQLDESIAAYGEAIKLRPDIAALHFNLANALRDRTQFADAIKSYRRAIQLKPDFAPAYINLGNVLKNMGQIDEAIDAHHSAVALNPNSVEAHNNLGIPLKEQGDLDGALAAFRHAISVNPAVPAPWHNLLYTLYFHTGYTPAAILAEHRKWYDVQARHLAADIKPYANHRSADRPLRIGYLFPNVHSHPAFAPPLLLNHDREKFKIFCYADQTVPDPVTALLQQHTDAWRSTRLLSHTQLADLIRADQIDILVDLVLHMSGSRLLALAQRPAPIQIAYLAYPGTTGLPTIDYRFTDQWLDPLGQSDDQFTETSIRLPRTFACYDPSGMDAPTHAEAPRPQDRPLTFGSRNNFCKINDYVLSLWAAALHAVPDSRFRLNAPSETGRRFVLDHLTRHNISPSRIEFTAKQSLAGYWNEFRQIDICLDTLPYSGHTTTLDALWMGVPTITRVGSTAAGRAGWSIYNNLNLTELAALNDEQFPRIAAELAIDGPRLRQLRRTLRDRLKSSPIMDAKAFARDVESAFIDLWKKR